MRRFRATIQALRMVPLAIFIFVAAPGCGTDYKDISDPNGRQAIMDEANNFLTSGMCEQAMDVLRPLFVSQWSNNQVTMLYAAGYACKAKFSFPALLYALVSTPGGVWSAIVKSNYSSSRTDGHIASLRSAVDTLRLTSSGGATDFSAGNRPQDANVYMIFLQTAMIGAVMSELGNADPATGDPRPKPAALAARTPDDQCDVAVAFANIKDSLSFAPTGSAMANLSTPIDAVCADAAVVAAGGCPSILDRTACLAEAAAPAVGSDKTKGEALIQAIAAMW